MLAAGLIAKCTISLISTLKQIPQQVGRSCLPALTFYGTGFHSVGVEEEEE